MINTVSEVNDEGFMTNTLSGVTDEGFMTITLSEVSDRGIHDYNPLCTDQSRGKR